MITFLSGDVSVGEAVRTLGREAGARSARVSGDSGAAPPPARLQLLAARARALDPAWCSGSGLCPEPLTLALSSFSVFQVLASTERELCCLGPTQAPRLSLSLCTQSPLAEAIAPRGAWVGCTCGCQGSWLCSSRCHASLLHDGTGCPGSPSVG